MVLTICNDGIHIVIDREDLFLSFDDFPWFRGADAATIQYFEASPAGHLRWPAMDIDLTLDSIRDPAQYPLIDRKR